jgi:hypothetical protein
MADDMKTVLKRLRSIELKLDVLIEAQALGGAVEAREAEQAEGFAERAAETAQRFRDARPR